MKTHILVFSWSKDVPYLDYCLRSIKKFCTGFTGVTIGVARRDAVKFHEAMFALSVNHKDHRLQLYDAPDDPVYGHISMQGEKCRAEHYVPSDTDLILFTDSDCVFTAPVTPEDYIVDGKPVLLIKEYAKITGNPWRHPTEEILRVSCPYSTMERHPAVHWREMFPQLRDRVEAIHQMQFTRYILTRKPDYPWGVSEFNLMGSYILSTGWKDRYNLVDVTNQPHPESSKKLVQFWSHSEIDKPQSTPWQLNLTPLDFSKGLGL